MREGTPLTDRRIHLYGGLFKFIIFKYNIKCFCWENTIKALGERDKEGWEDNIIMHFFFWRSGVIISCILWGLRCINSWGLLASEATLHRSK